MARWLLEKKSGGEVVYSWMQHVPTYQKIELARQYDGKWIATLNADSRSPISVSGDSAHEAVKKMRQKAEGLLLGAQTAHDSAMELDFEGFPFEVPKANTNGGE